MTENPFAALNALPRRVEGWSRGMHRIRWFVNSQCIADVLSQVYYREGHVHPADCKCDALVHSLRFHEMLYDRGYYKDRPTANEHLR